MELMRSLGADHVVDYTQTDFAKQDQKYDLILDAAAYRSVFDSLPALSPEGTYVLVGGSTSAFFKTMLIGPWISKFSRRKVKCLTSKPNQSDLLFLSDLLESGKIDPVVDRCYKLADLPDAIRCLEQRQVKGKIAIQVSG
jgi:NADPH:quinone reductase-like Zn-dependent oxidoreductase